MHRITFYLDNPPGPYDGGNALGDGAPPHSIVAPNLVPGEESKPANPMTRRGGDLESVLHRLKQHQIKDILKVRHHEQFCAIYRAALARAEELTADLKTADENIRSLAERNAALVAELETTKEALSAKSLPNRIREWGRQWRG